MKAPNFIFSHLPISKLWLNNPLSLINFRLHLRKHGDITHRPQKTAPGEMRQLKFQESGLGAVRYICIVVHCDHANWKIETWLPLTIPCQLCSSFLMGMPRTPKGFVFLMPGFRVPSPSCNMQVSPPASGARKYNNNDTIRCPGHPLSLLQSHSTGHQHGMTNTCWLANLKTSGANQREFRIA